MIKKSVQNITKIIMTSDVNLDSVLDEIGAMGKSQIITLLLLVVAASMTAFPAEYIFTTASIPTRCQIPECEPVVNDVFEPDWLHMAVPVSSGNYEQCSRFAIRANITDATCSGTTFDKSVTVECDGFVHERENTVVYEFSLECQEFTRVLYGALKSVGLLVGMPISGIISDRFGRRTVIVIGLMFSSVIGLIRSFSVTYEMFLVFGFREPLLAAGTYGSAYVLATEQVGVKYRIFAGGMMSSSFTLGQLIIGLVAWGVPYWRTYTRVLYAPLFFGFLYIWLIPESVRWLLSKQRMSESENILKAVAKRNGRVLSENTLNNLKDHVKEKLAHEAMKSDSQEESIFKQVIRSPVMLRRVCTIPVLWITATTVYYGMTINSIGFSGNQYLNYSLVILSELPGSWIAVLVMNRFGRKKTLFWGFVFCGACLIGSAFTPTDIFWLSLSFYLLGKSFISGVAPSVYSYTTELYPTTHRHRLLGFSSTIGRIGNIIVPLLPALMQYWYAIPTVIFCSLTFISAGLMLTMPETKDIDLPDTFSDAENIGRNSNVTS